LKGLTLEEAKELLSIDKDNLDDVCLTHADIFDTVADKHARAVSERDFKKDELSKVHSDIAKKLRSDASEKGEKITEKGIEASILLDEDYIEANEEYLEAKLEADLWSIRKDSFLQRSSMIKRLCELYLAGYYTSSSIKGVEEAGGKIGHDKDREVLKSSRRKKRRTQE